MELFKISVITVVYNDIKNIEKTISSVVNQSFKNIEYIIVDGKSTDGTINIIKKYRRFIKHIVSEKDSGIYDAMNKGIDLATGEWLLFLNSGDTLFSDTTISDAYKCLQESTEVIVYGDVGVVIPEYGIDQVVKARPIESINFLMPMNHQAVFIRSDYHKLNKYDLNFSIAADYFFFLTCYRDKHAFRYLGFPISKILAGGISDTRRNKTFTEMYYIRARFDPGLKNGLFYLRQVFSYQVSCFLKLVLPAPIKKRLLAWKYRRNEITT